MPRPTVSPTVLAAKGIPLTLANGREVRVCFTFQAIMTLEEQFGSINGAMEVLDAGENGAAFTNMARLLAIGLDHEEATDHGPLSDVKVLAEYLDPGQISEYGDTIGEAFKAAFPAAQGSDGDQDADPNSRGASGTGSPGSASASLMLSSGT